MSDTRSPESFRDFYCDTIEEAFTELRRRKSTAEGIITRLEESPYGGYRVYSVPVDLFVDDLADPIQPVVPGSAFSTRKVMYR